MMERFALFSGDDYDKIGGWGDLAELGDDPEALLSKLLEGGPNTTYWYQTWYQVVDLTERKVVREGNLRELRQERCEHKRTHWVEPPSQEPPFLVSGQYAIPGKYCTDCGLMLEQWTDPSPEGD